MIECQVNREYNINANHEKRLQNATATARDNNTKGMFSNAK